MLLPPIVDEQLAIFRKLLIDLRDRTSSMERATLYMQAQTDHDALVSLLEEAPPECADEISSVIDGYEVLIRSVMN